MNDTALPGIGHNQGPSIEDRTKELNERLDFDYRHLRARRDELLQAAERVPERIGLDDADLAGLVADQVKQIDLAIKTTDKTREGEKAWPLQAGRVVDGFFKAIGDPLVRARAALHARLNAYQRALYEEEQRKRREAEEKARAERERLEREAREAREREAEAERKAAEERARAERARSLAGATRAQEAAAAAERTAAEERARAASAQTAAAETSAHESAASEAVANTRRDVGVRGAYGGHAVARKVWKFEIVDPSAVPREYLTVDERAIREAVQKRSVREIPGLRIWEAIDTQVR